MAFTEHRDALGVLKRLLADCAEGNGHLVLVGGGLATGKTALLHEFSHYATETGALLLTATGSRAEQAVQTAVIDQLFHSSGLPADIAARMLGLLDVDALSEGELEADVSMLQHTTGVKVVHEICNVLLELSKERPVVIGIDDVQFVDRSSLQLLLYLRRRMNTSRVLMILNEWERPQPTLPLFRAEVTRRPHHLIQLAPLDESGIAERLAPLVDQDRASELASIYFEVSGGNPLLVNALIEDYRGTDRGSADNPDGNAAVGNAFARGVLACLHRWEPRLLDVARGIAVLGAEGTPAMIGRLMGLKSETAVQVVEILTAAGLLAGGKFRHPVAEAAVLDSMSPDERSRMHITAAGLLYQRGASASEVARHFIAADKVVGSWSIVVMRDAAEQALVADDVNLAVRCLELALDASTDERERNEVMKALARVVWRINPSIASHYLAPLRQAAYDGKLTRRDAVTVIRNSLWQGDVELVNKAMEVLDTSTGVADLQLAAELRVAYQWFYGLPCANFRNVDDSPVPGGPQPVSDGIWAGTANTLGMSNASTQRAREAATSSAEHILQSCRLGDTSLEVLGTAVLALVFANKAGKAASWCDALMDEAVRRRAITWQAMLGSMRADIALRRGQLATAVLHAETARELLQTQSWGVLIGYPLTTLLLANTAMGRYDAAAEVLKEIVPDAMFGTLFGIRYLRARGHYHLAVDRVLAAISDFQTCGKLMRERDLDVPALAPWRSDLAEANLHLGRKAVARELVAEQLERSGPIDSRTRGISLRVLAASSDLPQRPTLLRQAVECLQVAGDRLELSRALADLSQVHQEMGEFDRARMMARRAAQESKACQSGTLPPQAPRERAAGEVVKEADAQAEIAGAPILSDAERRVALLAALGHTNREIGRRLYITVSTVEQHLTRVYRKLSVHSRADLPAGLALHGVSEMADADGNQVDAGSRSSY